MLDRIGVFDTETTGVDVLEDRIVSAYVGVLDAAGNVITEGAWMLNPGVEIPEAATAVHGITTERAQAEGVEPRFGVWQIVQTLAGILEQGIPVAIFNAPFDLTILDAEFRRHCAGHGLEWSVDETAAEDDLIFEPWLRPIVDPFVIDKHLDRYRRGKRTLQALAEHYGVPLPDGDFHGARFDAVLAGRLALRLMPTRAVPLDDVHQRQVEWAREQRESFADYLRAKGNTTEADAILPHWPILPHPDDLEELGDPRA